MTHPSHQTRMSDSSLYDERCKLCGATDARGNGNPLDRPCPSNPNYIDPEVKRLQDLEAFVRQVKDFFKAARDEGLWVGAGRTNLLPLTDEHQYGPLAKALIEEANRLGNPQDN